jgi:hypothetical protein
MEGDHIQDKISKGRSVAHSRHNNYTSRLFDEPGLVSRSCVRSCVVECIIPMISGNLLLLEVKKATENSRYTRRRQKW